MDTLLVALLALSSHNSSSNSDPLPSLTHVNKLGLGLGTLTPCHSPGLEFLWTVPVLKREYLVASLWIFANMVLPAILLLTAIILPKSRLKLKLKPNSKLKLKPKSKSRRQKKTT
jgi:hypothetical protein